VRRLAAHAADAGADIREGERVTIEELDADAIVVAGDGFISQLLPELPVRSTRGQMLATEPLRERLYDRPHYARGDLVARAILGERPPELEIFDVARSVAVRQAPGNGG